MSETVERTLTLQEIEQAYEKTGLRILSGTYLGDDSCGCPIAAVAISEGAERNEKAIGSWAAQILGLSYRDGFTDGFDSRVHDAALEDVRYVSGFALGREVRRVFKGRGKSDE